MCAPLHRLNRLITPSKPCAKSQHGEACIAQKQQIQARCLQPVHRRPTRPLVRQPRTIQRRLHTNTQQTRQVLHEVVLRGVLPPSPAQHIAPDTVHAHGSTQQQRPSQKPKQEQPGRKFGRCGLAVARVARAASYVTPTATW